MKTTTLCALSTSILVGTVDLAAASHEGFPPGYPGRVDEYQNDKTVFASLIPTQFFNYNYNYPTGTAPNPILRPTAVSPGYPSKPTESAEPEFYPGDKESYYPPRDPDVAIEPIFGPADPVGEPDIPIAPFFGPGNPVGEPDAKPVQRMTYPFIGFDDFIPSSPSAGTAESGFPNTVVEIGDFPKDSGFPFDNPPFEFEKYFPTGYPFVDINKSTSTSESPSKRTESPATTTKVPPYTPGPYAKTTLETTTRPAPSASYVYSYKP
jgi:hypothetical protein